MNDEQAIRRGHDTRAALDVIGPVLDDMLRKATDALLEATDDQTVIQCQNRAKAISDLRKTLLRHVTDGVNAEALAVKRNRSGASPE